ncbi:hypothetical protein K491DRAFT_694369 [Lophiostoma macrostomum CBS 122681]|uniref:SprT-like domain-containing protein n=1 Tax=Lophiostoma macrostomum CBS 122681 TaxID=1314788 RepID=A0A6A6T4J8_9PLEO|nr:hypothetical protein K491DRAFT_694369 [Lophiostoma macrostomum CBS 122681]
MTYNAALPLVRYNNESAVGFPQLQSPWDLEQGHWYEPDPYNHPRRPLHIRRLQDDQVKCERNLGWSIEYATAFIVNHLDPAHSPDAAATLKRICTRASQLARDGRGVDVAYDLFNQLNQCLFADRLRDAVYMEIGPMGPDISGATFTHGHGPNPRVKRVTIMLNSDVHGRARGKEVIASLIHHMIHAYFLIACGPQTEEEVEYGRLSHGLAFAKVSRTIKNLTIARGGRPILRLGFGHVLSPRNHYYDEYHDHTGSEQFKIEKEDWYQSYCPAHVLSLPVGDMDKWYNAACAPLLDLPKAIRENKVLIFNKRNELEKVPRGKATPSNSSLEFLIDKKSASVLVPKKLFEDFLSIKAAFDKKKSRYMDIKLDKVPKDAFMTLLELLHTGSYSPDLAAVMGEGRMGGPPVIKGVRSGGKEYLGTDVRMWNLGVELGFDEVKSVAMDRLRAQCACYEDPVEVLRDVYKEKDPEPEMRQYVKEFLMRAPMPEGAYDGALGVGAAALTMGMGMAAANGASALAGTPNLWKLQQELCFRERFLDLMDQCGALHIDVLKAEEMLAAQGRTPSPPSRYGVGVVGPYSPPAPALLPTALSNPLSLSMGMGVGMGMSVPGLPVAGVPLPVAPRPLTIPWTGLSAGSALDEYERVREIQEERALAAQMSAMEMLY